jgi:flagellar biosynthesis anti-sigma factor FlgM
MRIDNNNPGSTGVGHTTGPAETQLTSPASKGSATNSPSSADGLQLSPFAGTLSEVMQSDAASRTQRVAQLAAAVQSGTYQVDPMAVSRAIVDQAISTGPSAQ